MPSPASLILLINIVGGFAIGMLQHDLSAGQAANSYILLAVGDALVAQIPGLLISVAAAMVVSRVGKDQDMGRQIVQQLFMSPRVLGVAAAILIMLGLIPGMPHAVFLVMGSGLGYAAWLLHQRANAPKPVEAPPAPAGDGEASWDDLQPVDLLGLELGYRLISLVDKSRQGDLLTRIKGGAPQVRPGSRLPSPGGARARQPRAQAQRLSHHAARRGGGRGRGVPGHVPGDQPRRHQHAAHRHAHHRPGIRPARPLDRRPPEGSRTNGGFYGR